MANAIQCDVCKKCYVPNRKNNSCVVHPVLIGKMVNSIENTVQQKDWDLCYDCFDRINTFITTLSPIEDEKEET